MNQTGMQVIVLPQSGLHSEQSTHRSITPRLSKQFIGLGVVHILNGVLCIIFQSINLENFQNFWNHGLAFIGYGLWTGLPFLVTGIIGITAGIRKSKCQVIAFNILSIISAALASFLIIFAVISAYNINVYGRYRSRQGYNRDYNYPYYSEREYNSRIDRSVAMEAIPAALGIIEGVIAIWSSIVCCLIGVCNCCLPPQTQPVFLNGEQQAALMCNPMFMPNQQESMMGFHPQQQHMDPHSKQQLHVSPYTHNNFMSATNALGSYTDLNAEMRRNPPSSHMEAQGCIVTSTFEEI